MADNCGLAPLNRAQRMVVSCPCCSRAELVPHAALTSPHNRSYFDSKNSSFWRSEKGSVGCLYVRTYGRISNGVFGGCVRQPLNRTLSHTQFGRDLHPGKSL